MKARSQGREDAGVHESQTPGEERGHISKPTAAVREGEGVAGGIRQVFEVDKISSMLP